MILLSNPVWLLALTLLAYYLFNALSKILKSPIINPVLWAAALLIGYLLVFNISYTQYAVAGGMLSFWLKPSVVALGVLLYRQLQTIKMYLLPIILSQAAASVVGIASSCWAAALLDAPREVVLSLAPKSVTTPIAVEVSGVIGGIAPLTVAAVIVTGIFGSMVGFQLLRLSGIKHSVAQGVALGSAAHGLGVMAASEHSGEKLAAFATVGLIFNGIFTAVLAPVLVPYLV